MQKRINYPKVTFWDITKAFWAGIKPHTWLLVFVLFFAISTNVIAIIVPVFYKYFFDFIASGAGKADAAGTLVSIIVYIAMLHGVLWILYRFHSFLNSRFQAKVIAILKQQAYDYLMEHSYGFFTNNFTGSLVQKVNRFGRSFEKLADRILWDLLSLPIKIPYSFLADLISNQGATKTLPTNRQKLPRLIGICSL